MSEKPVIYISEPNKTIENYSNGCSITKYDFDNSHLYYKGKDLGTFKELYKLKDEIKSLYKAITKLRLRRTKWKNRYCNEKYLLRKEKKKEQELLNWLESKNKIILQQHNIVEPVIKVQEVIDKIKEDL